MGLQRTMLALVLLVAAATPAFADATLFIGNSSAPANRPTKGLAFGTGLVVVGFEFEFADVSQSAVDAEPGLRTGMGNVLLQTPFPIAGMQFYATTGAGVYRETLGDLQETNIGMNTGGGVKVSLLGPVRARLDYRIFRLRGEPLHATVHRLYAGLNLAF